MKEREGPKRISELYFLEQLLVREYDLLHKEALARYRKALEDGDLIELYDDGLHLVVRVHNQKSQDRS